MPQPGRSSGSDLRFRIHFLATVRLVILNFQVTPLRQQISISRLSNLIYQTKIVTHHSKSHIGPSCGTCKVGIISISNRFHSFLITEPNIWRADHKQTSISQSRLIFFNLRNIANFLESVERANVVESLDDRRQAAVQAEHFAVHQSRLELHAF